MNLNRKVLAENFPQSGKVRAKQAAAFLGIAVSTYWKYVKDGKIKKPVKYGARVSVWDADYLRDISKRGF